jgi:(p)ppGpp synthase/HD superfamily hydrolase
MTTFSQRIHETLDFAAFHHRRGKRKDADITIPYVSHLFGVCYILAQYDFDEDIVVAGILHDFLEDVVQEQHDEKLENEMRERFGKRVHKLVSLVTQQKRDVAGKKLPWLIRGEQYRKVLLARTTPDGARAISCADKIHNIESLLMALGRLKGDEKRMWGKLKATPAQQLEKFWMLHDGIRQAWQHPIVDEFGRKIDALEKAMS